MKLQLNFIPLLTITLLGTGEKGPSGAGMALTALIIVFVVLVALYFIYKLLSLLHSLDIRNRFIKRKGLENATEISTEAISGEVNAAIVMTLFLYQNELHDIENTVLTIKKVSRTYSPWNSKIYGLRKNPR
jgi:hypothetical protein